MVGGDFDFQFLKDVTFVNLGPEFAVFELTRFSLVSNCTTGSSTVVTGTSTKSAFPSATAKSHGLMDGPTFVLLLLSLL